MSIPNPLHNAAAIILAAGLSRRMESPKMLLPWGKTTVIEQTLFNVEQAGIGQIIVVTGGFRENIELVLKGHLVQLVFNPDYENGEMLCSIKQGLSHLDNHSPAVFIVLGDQPDIPPEIYQDLWECMCETGGGIVLPSYNQRRGHPWLVTDHYWKEILDLQPPSTLRDFLNLHGSEIRYVTVESPVVLHDLDTPEDYQKYKPEINS